jgi:hypothetical protein
VKNIRLILIRSKAFLKVNSKARFSDQKNNSKTPQYKITVGTHLDIQRFVAF